MKYFKSYLPINDVKTEEGNIPKKIFMTWSSHELSNTMYNNVQLWVEKNPDWELHLYDDQECIELIESNFDQDVLDTYNNLFPTAYKADLFRYCLLYIYGGVYTDVKMVPLEPLSEIITKDIDFLSAKDRLFDRFEFDGYIFQAFLCAKPKHQFFKQAIKMIVENSQTGYYGNDPLCPTGPGLLGRAINICCNKSKTSKIELGIHCINNFNFELLKHGDSAIVDNNNKQLILDRYSDYRKELHSGFELARRYNACWFIDRAYIKSHKPRSKKKYFLKNKFTYTLRYVYFVKIVKILKKIFNKTK